MTPNEQAIVNLAISILENALREPGQAITSPESVKQFLRLHLELLEHEAFGVLFLDNAHRLINFDVMFKGSIDKATVYPREVAKRALELNAAAIVIAHNHPSSGNSEPSAADKRLTLMLKEVMALLDVRLVDHLVVGRNQISSFAERGWL